MLLQCDYGTKSDACVQCNISLNSLDRCTNALQGNGTLSSNESCIKHCDGWRGCCIAVKNADTGNWD